MTTCRDCGLSWGGLCEAHCTVCHAHFASDPLADHHRLGSFADRTRRCVDPASVTKRDGRPVYRLDGHVWRSYKRRPAATMPRAARAAAL